MPRSRTRSCHLLSTQVSLSVVDGRIRHMLLTKRIEGQEVAADRDDVRACTVPDQLAAVGPLAPSPLGKSPTRPNGVV